MILMHQLNKSNPRVGIRSCCNTGEESHVTATSRDGGPVSPRAGEDDPPGRSGTDPYVSTAAATLGWLQQHPLQDRVVGRGGGMG